MYVLCKSRRQFVTAMNFRGSNILLGSGV